MLRGLDALDPCKVLQFGSHLKRFAEHHTPSDITPAIPPLISLLEPAPGPPPAFDESSFVLASDALQELMIHPPFHDGSGSKTLTEPLLIWIERWGGVIVASTIQSEVTVECIYDCVNQSSSRIC